jgi:hypothetical protein
MRRSKSRRLFLATLAALSTANLFHASAQSDLPPRPQGLFVLNDDSGKTPRPLPDSVYNDPLVDGVSLRAGWMQIEPAEGKYTWPFDQDIERAKKANKRIFLRAYSGLISRPIPAWVHEAGAKHFDFAGGEKTGAHPVPWDLTHLGKWKNLIKAMGQRYGKEDAVVLVQMAGLDITGGEMHLTRTDKDIEAWKKAGYTKQKLVAAWQSVIDAYADAFPNKYLALNVSKAIQNDGAVDDVLTYAKKRLGARLCVQHNALSAKTVEDKHPNDWVRSYRREAIIGFQQLCPKTPRGAFNDEGRRFGGNLDRALQIGLDAGMSYLEIYPPDVANESLRPTLEEYAKKMKASAR